jgi:hypothetical protein
MASLTLLRIAIAVVLTVTLCVPAQAQKSGTNYGKVAGGVVDVSLVDLLAGGSKYHGKIVRVSGVLNLEFEGNALFLSKEHFRHRIYKNAVWFSPDYARLGVEPKELAKLNGRYVLVEGRFDAQDTGHMGLFSGAIQDASRVLVLED